MKKITQSLLLFYPLPKKKKEDLHYTTQHTRAHNSTIPPLNRPLTHRLHYSHSKITTFITITKKKFHIFCFFPLSPFIYDRRSDNSSKFLAGAGPTLRPGSEYPSNHTLNFYFYFSKYFFFKF